MTGTWTRTVWGLAVAAALPGPGGAAMAAAGSGEGVFLPGAPWPDDRGVHINAHGGGVLYHEGTYYWFGEHKVAGRRGNRAWHGVHVYASDDLYRWTDLGIALAVSPDADSPIRAGCVIERPKVVHHAPSGTFVMWFHLELYGRGYEAALTGLAVADRPAGPYRFVRALRPNAGAWPIGFDADTPDGDLCRRDFAGGQMSRDMTLFVDDDGTGYHVHAAEENYTLHVSELTPDYRDFTGRYARILPMGHNEAPALCKRQGRYYLLTSGCTGWAPNAARLAVADHPFGPWTPLGNPCRGTNPANGLGPERTFGGQSTFLLPVAGREDAFIALFDAWEPRNPIDGRYYWLPVRFEGDGLVIEWMDAWSLSWFDRDRAPAQAVLDSGGRGEAP